MIYLDNAATTKLREEVLAAMLPFLQEDYGNPSGVYGLARHAYEAMDAAREKMRNALGAAARKEIIFTSGGTEANGLALKGVARANQNKGKHMITSAVEHHAILNTCAALEKEGFCITYIKPNGQGMVLPEDIEAAIRPDTILVSIMWANNEVGTINPVRHIAEIAHNHDILFHTDAVQAVGHVDIDVVRDGIDLLSLSAHKFHGPKGVGALYLRDGVLIEPLQQGGKQERGLRAGTENVAGIVGMAEALRLACAEREPHSIRLAQLRDSLLTKIRTFLPEVVVNGAPYHRSPGSLSLSFPGYQASDILFHLDEAGIACSGGAACTAAEEGPSHVLKAMGVSNELAQATIRFSLSRYTTIHEINQVAKVLQEILHEQIAGN